MLLPWDAGKVHADIWPLQPLGRSGTLHTQKSALTDDQSVKSCSCCSQCLFLLCKSAAPAPVERFKCIFSIPNWLANRNEPVRSPPITEELPPCLSVANTVWMLFLSFFVSLRSSLQSVLDHLSLTKGLGLLPSPGHWDISGLFFMLYVWQVSGKSYLCLQWQGIGWMAKIFP